MGIRKLVPLFFLLISIGFAACCSCGGENNTVKGIITIVGNEPFTKLAVKLENNKNYILDCSEELKQELWKQQGNYYAIQFSESKMVDGLPVLVVEKAIQLNQNTNK